MYMYILFLWFIASFNRHKHSVPYFPKYCYNIIIVPEKRDVLDTIFKILPRI